MGMFSCAMCGWWDGYGKKAYDVSLNTGKDNSWNMNADAEVIIESSWALSKSQTMRLNTNRSYSTGILSTQSNVQSTG